MQQICRLLDAERAACECTAQPFFFRCHGKGLPVGAPEGQELVHGQRVGGRYANLVAQRLHDFGILYRQSRERNDALGADGEGIEPPADDAVTAECKGSSGPMVRASNRQRMTLSPPSAKEVENRPCTSVFQSPTRIPSSHRMGRRLSISAMSVVVPPMSCHRRVQRKSRTDRAPAFSSLQLGYRLHTEWADGCQSVRCRSWCRPCRR